MNMEAMTMNAATHKHHPVDEHGGVAMNSAQKRHPIYNYINMEHIILSTASLKIVVDVVSDALRWIASRGDSRTTHAILLTG